MAEDVSSRQEVARAPTCGDAGGVNGLGEPCRSQVIMPSGMCAHHDPEHKATMKLVYRAGGQAAKHVKQLAARMRDTVAPHNLPTVPPDSIAHLATWHRWTVHAVATGQIDPRVAAEIRGCLRELRPILVGLGLERRVRELEASLKKARGDR
jgi:hypothetical protein